MTAQAPFSLVCARPPQAEDLWRDYMAQRDRVIDMGHAASPDDMRRVVAAFDAYTAALRREDHT